MTSNPARMTPPTARKKDRAIHGDGPERVPAACVEAREVVFEGVGCYYTGMRRFSLGYSSQVVLA
jgi:hypothetical protein